MEKVELFSIPNISFSNAPEFREYLVENYDSNKVDHDLTIIVGITNYKSDEFFQALESFGFTIQRTLGSVYHMKFDLIDALLEFYVTHDNETKVVIFYTNFRKTEEIPKIRDFLKYDLNTYYLFFKPMLMKQIAEELSNKYENLEILQEFEYRYGVLLSKFIINIPDLIKFKIDDGGLFTFSHGHLNILFEILGKAVDESRKTMEAFNGSSFKVLPIKTAHRSFNIPSSTPVSIHLQNKIAFYEIDEVKSKIESNYTIIDFIAQEGSLFLSTDLISKSGYQFRIKGNENHIKMFPDGELKFGEFMKFYEFILHSTWISAHLVTMNLT